MTVKQARGFFILMLIVLVILGIYQCFTMAHAFNLSPFTYQIRERGVSANYAYISGDTLYMNNMAVSVAAVLKAVALQADTLRGSSNIVGILDSALRIDPDSSSAVNVITFGGYGGGLRWNRATDKVQFTNDFSTWTDIGSGGSGSAGAEIHDSLDANWATFTAGGGSADSNAITYETDRVAQYSDTGLYLGDIGDSTMLWYDLTADNIKAYVILYYVDDISDSALMSKYWIETTIGDSLSANGFLTGLNSTNGISGGASQNIVNIQLDPTFFAVGGDTVRIQNLNAGKLAFNVFGSPTDYDELVITENTLTTRTLGSWRVVYTNGSYALAGATVGAANTVFVGNGTSSAPSFRALTDADIPNNITISLADSTSGGAARATTSKTADSTAGGAARATTAKTADSTNGGAIRSETTKLLLGAQGSANTFGRLTGDSLIVDTAFATRMNVTNLKVGSDAFITDITGDGLAISGGALIASLGQAIVTGEITDGTILWADLDSLLGVKQYVRAIYHDSIAADFGATMTITGNWVNTTNPWAVNEGGTGAATFTQNGILYGNGTSAIGVTAQGASGTVLHGNAGTPTFSAVVSADITDGTIALGDLASNSVDSTKIVDASIGSGDIGTGRITTTHVLDASLVGGDMATGTIDSVRLGAGSVKAAELDTTVTYTVGSLRTRLANNGGIFSNNYQVRDPDSTLKIGGGAGLTIGSNLRYGSDITDDTIWVDYYPEPQSMTLGDRIMPTYKDSMKIYGDVDSCGNLGNVLVFSDSLLNSGNHRRSLHYTITHPHNVDSLRYILVYGLVKDSSGTNEMYLRGALRTTPWTRSCADSLTAGNIKDYDSLGGDFGDNQVKRSFALTGGAVTAGGAWYLLVTGRHDAGTAYNWAEVGLIRCVYSKLGPD